MIITHTEIFRFSIPMHPFTIATGTMHFAQNIFIRIHTDENIYGVGECSAFPMIVGETQDTCMVMAGDFARIWKGKDPLDIEQRMDELHSYAAGNTTAKSAFDMALYDIAAKYAGKPLYTFLGGNPDKKMQTDLTIGIDTPANMSKEAVKFKEDGAKIIKVKLGKDPIDDIERIRQIRAAIGYSIALRIDANQGWSLEQAGRALTALAPYEIAFCEQPMRRYNDHLLPALKKISPIPIMADESVFDHHDAERIIKADGCDYVNIKFSKSSGIREAIKINDVCAQNNIPCMIGCMMESRIALTAFAHFAAASENVRFYDMDTCLMGLKEDPVTGGIRFHDFYVELPRGNGIGADADELFLSSQESFTV